MKNTDQTLFLVLLRFLRATPFVVFVSYLFYGLSGLFCCVIVPGALLVLHLLYTLIHCDLFGLLCLTVCDHKIISCISLA